MADKGFSGKEFKALTKSMTLRLLRPDRKDETYRNGNLGGVRQWWETGVTSKRSLTAYDR